ncbi:MAG: 50S ribosomal protein L2 [Cuniculiplasma sp.]
MGKLIIPQRRGKGGLIYRSPSHRHVSAMRIPLDGNYQIKDIIHAPGRNSPVLVLDGGEKKNQYQIAFNGAYVSQKVNIGKIENPKSGDSTYLGFIPDGSLVHNIETVPGDGGKLCRTAGTYSQVISHGEFVSIKLPSGAIKSVNPQCRATVGTVAGTGAKDIPILKAGRHIHYLQSKAKKAISVRGVAMNAVNHPHGGGNHQHVGRPSTVGRGTPPGRKVGRLSPKRRKVK